MQQEKPPLGYKGRQTYKVDLDPKVATVPSTPVARRSANVVGSLRPDGLHSPVLDIDFAAELVGSSHRDHHHLYLDGLTLTWRQYKRLLRSLARAGVISKSYCRHSLRQRQTLVRLPWVKKTTDEASS